MVLTVLLVAVVVLLLLAAFNVIPWKKALIILGCIALAMVIFYFAQGGNL